METITFELLSPTNAGIIDFPAFLLGTILAILFPGPNSLYILAVTIQKGWRFGAWGALGVFIGDSILMAAVALGAATLLTSSLIAFNALRIIGSVYLVWMGFGLLRNGWQRWTLAFMNQSSSDIQIRLMQLHPFLAALTLSVTNPKVIFFFVAFFSQFIRADFAHPTYTFFYLAIVLQIISMTYLSCLIASGQMALRFFQRRPRLAALLWMVAGVLFVGFAVRLILP